MKVLVTGFDPFGNETINPSIEAVKLLPDTIGNAEIIKLEVYTNAKTCLEQIEAAIIKYNPDIVLSIGQAAGRDSISLERIGINVDDFRILDNGGNQIINEPVFENGPDAYFTNLPIYSMLDRLKSESIPCHISNTAGTFVCNHVLYGIRHICSCKYPHIQSGFIHIPLICEQVTDNDRPSLPLETSAKAIELCIDEIVKNYI